MIHLSAEIAESKVMLCFSFTYLNNTTLSTPFIILGAYLLITNFYNQGEWRLILLPIVKSILTPSK